MEVSHDAKMLLLGGAISLVSALLAIVAQQVFELFKRKHELRQYPTQALFNKQLEFCDKVIPAIAVLNSYITTIDVWLRENAVEHAKEFAQKNNVVGEFNDIIDNYKIYLPGKVLDAGYDLISECIPLFNSSPTTSQTGKCMRLLFNLQNTIREGLGSDRISGDLQKAFQTNRSHYAKN